MLFDHYRVICQLLLQQQLSEMKRTILTMFKKFLMPSCTEKSEQENNSVDWEWNYAHILDCSIVWLWTGWLSNSKNILFSLTVSKFFLPKEYYGSCTEEWWSLLSHISLTSISPWLARKWQTNMYFFFQ